MIILRNLLILSAAVSAAAAKSSPPQAHELDESYTFDEYLSHHGKDYSGDTEEYSRRQQIFEKNLKMILAHNEGKMDESGELLNGGYVMGVNRFTDVDLEELPMGYNKNLHPDWSSQLMMHGEDVLAVERRRLGGLESYQQSPDFEMEEVSALPQEVDWAKAGNMNPHIPQQSSCGSCWTFAATACVEAALSIATGEAPMSLSEQNLLECTPDPLQCGGTGGCEGATIELAYNFVADQTKNKKGGMFYLSDVGYQAMDETCDGLTKGKAPVVGIEGWVKLPKNNYKAVMNAVAKVGPVGLALAAGNWAFYEKGVFEHIDTEVNHAVVLVGYGVDKKTKEKYWKIRNSWGLNFGEQGYIRVKRSDDDDTNCGMDNKPLVGVACALDDGGKKLDVKPVKVCGTCAVLFDASYPVGPRHLN